MKRVLVWFRRDLRVADHTALYEACRQAGEVLPVFVLDPRILKSADTGSRRVAYLLGCLLSLDQNLRHLGSRLILRHDDPLEAVPALASESGAEAVFWNRDYESYAIQRDARVSDRLRAAGVDVQIFEDQCLCPPGSVTKDDGLPYTVFTPFSRKWRLVMADTPRPLPRRIPTPAGLDSDPIPDAESLDHCVDIVLPETGERAARRRLDAFLSNGMDTYDRDRDFPHLNRTSRLSADLRFGSIGPRTVYHAALRHGGAGGALSRGAQVFISELIWRDFYKHILHFFPHVETGAFRREYDAVEWENRHDFFEAWCVGETGFPIVDAAMRQLNQTGWMHNRLRMITASFLTKDLLVDWRWGERYFMKQLLDGDTAANNGGWQWAAGTGTDAQPYFRIFNPFSQAKKFDPEGRFIALTTIPANVAGNIS